MGGHVDSKMMVSRRQDVLAVFCFAYTAGAVASRALK